MSHRLKYYTGEVLKEMSLRMSGITPNVFSENRPESVTEQMREFIVVDIATKMYNHNPYQDAYVSIELYMRKKAKGLANTANMQAFADRVVELFPIVTDRFSIIKPSVMLRGSDMAGFTTWMITAKLYVNTTDSYFTPNTSTNNQD